MELKSYLLEIALRRPREVLEREFWGLPFEAYAPVRRQFVTMFKAVNERRLVAGLDGLGISFLRLRRRIFRPFEVPEGKVEVA